MESNEYGVDTLVEAYVALRDEKRELERNVALKVEQLDKEMQVLTTAMNDLCKELGADSIRTNYGTVIRTVKTKYWTNDWSAFHRLMKDNDAFELLEKRIHQTNMKTFMEENPDLHPEGLNMDKEYAITIRKKS